MKKSKLMIGVLVASISLLGTGYAYWTDQLTVNASVETGNLNVKYSAEPTFATGELQEQIGNPGSPEVPEIPGTDPVPGIPGTPGQPAVYKDIQIRKLSEWKGEGTPGWNVELTAKCASFTDIFGKTWYTHGETKAEAEASDNIYKHFNKGMGVPKSGWYTTGSTPGSFYSDPSSRYYTVLVSEAIEPVEGTPDTPATPGTPGTPEVPATGNEVVVKDSEGYATAEVAEWGDKGIKVQLNNLYPGSFVSTTFVAENDGTIPAVIDTVKLSSVNMDTENDKKFSDQLQVIAEVIKVGDAGTEFGDVDLSKATSLSKIDETLKAAYGDLRLEKGDKVTTRLTIIFPGNAAQNDEFETLTEQSFGLEINWIQHNALTTKAKEVVPAE